MDLSIAIKLAILGIHLQILSIGLYLKLGKSSFDTAFETKQANEIEFIPNEEFNSIYPNT